ncbi:hypothetical protein CRM22_001697 [Opisthorchis felineus]|uniref:Thioredoxin domain-containing protein n=1 Tax=Opisthorchis felineus TaxID=147828 RepID=A0A4S2M9C1_OPIFE|nr:hypothetical protein CRM22_001697 [Opisthorchis felineus]
MVVLCLLFSPFLLCTFCSGNVININSTNWHQTFSDEWFLEFFAPWCPACRQFSAVWKQLSDEPGLGVHIAAVDVTESPVLSFVFFVRQLPTLFHVKDGVFRLYNGSRNFIDLHRYLIEKQYIHTEPISWYYSPSTFHMQLFFRFMELGMTITNVHQYLLDSGYPTWLSFIIIGSGTIIFGLVLGTILVILFDCIVPPRPQIYRFFARREEPRKSTISPSASTTKKTEEREILTPGTHKLSVDASGEHQDESEELEVRKRTGDSKD